MTAVKLDKLVKKLRRDVAASPMKATVLGVLFLGGLYFWGPLAWKWIRGKGTAAAPQAVADTQQPAATGASTQVAVINQAEANLPWREVRKRKENDPLARSANFRQSWSEIFQVAATPTAGTAQVEVTRREDFDPQKLGLILQGVAIGPRSKKAIISGKVYSELDVVPAKSAADIQFRLVHVQRKMVVLEHGGSMWSLKLASTDSTKPHEEQTSQVEPVKQLPSSPKDEKQIELSGKK